MPGESSDNWFALMKQCRWETAWEISDKSLRSRAGKSCWHMPRHLQYIWNGELIEGKKVLVRCYHGLGDTIQFIRFTSSLKKIAKEVIVWAQPKLIALVNTVDGIDKLLPLHDGTPDVEYDADVEIMELPHIFRTTLHTLPCSVPYIHVDPALLKNDGTLKVGLVWKAGDWNEERSMPFQMYYSLAAIEGITFYILQPDAVLAGWKYEFGIHPGEFEVAEYATYIKAMDLLISIDSMPVHLAGAMGIPVWNLLQLDADWRWMDNRDDSPWYPTMRLFRQRVQGEWEPVIARVKQELEQLVRQRNL
jgi:hypothetical protein